MESFYGKKEQASGRTGYFPASILYAEAKTPQTGQVSCIRRLSSTALANPLPGQIRR